MSQRQHTIKFDSGTGWTVKKLIFMPQYGIRAEVLFAGEDGCSIYLELRGIRSPEQLLSMLTGFDAFLVLTRQTESSYPAGERFLLRYFIDDDIYETFIDDYEAYRTTSTNRASHPSPDRRESK